MELSPNITAEQAVRIYAMYLGAVNESPNSEGECNSWTLRYMANEFPKYKLRLKSLSKVSKSDFAEIARLRLATTDTKDREWVYGLVEESPIPDALAMVSYEQTRNGEYVSSGHIHIYARDFANYPVRDYLIQRHYAVPLFIALKHPDNGKMAKQLGLAVKSRRA